jgi:ABC-type spermidine/putrescine transport system, permease component I
LKTSQLERKSRLTGILYSLPMGLWLALFFLIPILIIFCYSFMTASVYGGAIPRFTLTAYKKLFSQSFLKVSLRTLVITLISTAITMLIALPSSYAMARSRNQTLFLALIIIPFWTNSLIRIYAWINILSAEGFINSLLLRLNLIEEPLSLIYNSGAVILVLVYMYLPFAILPLFTTIDRFDFTLLDAARDLGAGKLKSILLVLIPNIRSGFLTALIFTFIPIFGAYTVPLLVGGKSSTMAGNIIVDQVQKTRNWPLASAFSVILTIISLSAVIWMLKNEGRERKRKREAPHEKTVTLLFFFPLSLFHGALSLHAALCGHHLFLQRR